MSAIKQIGPSFYDEIVAAGLVGLPFSWSADGTIIFDPLMTAAQIASVESVYAAHNPDTPSWSAYQQSARAALSDSDLTVMRCYENAVALPVAWASYRKALRAIVGAASGDAAQPLLAKPTYPSGT
jgi:hypothetical protein